MSYRLRPAAQADIEGIVLYIAVDNPAAASGWLDDLQKKLRALGASRKWAWRGTTFGKG